MSEAVLNASHSTSSVVSTSLKEAVNEECTGQNTDLNEVRGKGPFLFPKGKGQVAGIHLGYCIAHGCEVGGPFLQDKCAVVEIELAEPA